MKVQNTQHFEKFSLIQNNPSGASRHLPLHKGGFDFCETTKNRFIDTLEPHIAALFVGAAARNKADGCCRHFFKTKSRRGVRLRAAYI